MGETLSLSSACEEAWVQRCSVVVYLMQVECPLPYFRTSREEGQKALTLDPKMNIIKYWF